MLAAFAVLALTCPAPASAQTDTSDRGAQRIDIAMHVREAAQRFSLPEHWIYAVIRIESAGRTRAVSPAGAMGLMQLMPGTWARQRDRFALGSDPFDPRDNILAGTSYLREMFDRYGTEGFLAAYNAGPGRYEQWLSARRPLPLETRDYVARVTSLLQADRMFLAEAKSPAPAEPLSLAHGETDLPANPFARPAEPAHDLFAPVSTVSDR
ncbi:lytic transglycosylase domain-containing protein [Pelagerythrobacter marinus]|uniref:lytic transglycosylase domain-containing protein n=1 Tax=Pelagerythrobacter marinus TaxID=538382 RepID=UPI002036CCC9|nr:lytic transglycosylase domain-containing protein [Pelagerythrobacter marinus]USA38893.1 lytic transglycosylase domain-containing protein [Pelagerythrobacter marinus]WPZ07027.1 lytic transglycosylase domain-containing protein [Pelagerythrobacter marinus]